MSKPDKVTPKVLGPRCENIYNLLTEKAMKTSQVAHETRTSVGYATSLLNMLYKANLIERDRTTQESVWYTDANRKQAMILFSGSRAEEVYKLAKKVQLLYIKYKNVLTFPVAQ